MDTQEAEKMRKAIHRVVTTAQLAFTGTYYISADTLAILKEIDDGSQS
jgi:hypothetical protein